MNNIPESHNPAKNNKRKIIHMGNGDIQLYAGSEKVTIDAPRARYTFENIGIPAKLQQILINKQKNIYNHHLFSKIIVYLGVLVTLLNIISAIIAMQTPSNLILMEKYDGDLVCVKSFRKNKQYGAFIDHIDFCQSAELGATLVEKKNRFDEQLREFYEKKSAMFDMINENEAREAMNAKKSNKEINLEKELKNKSAVMPKRDGEKQITVEPVISETPETNKQGD